MLCIYKTHHKRVDSQIPFFHKIFSNKTEKIARNNKTYQVFKRSCIIRRFEQQRRGGIEPHELMSRALFTLIAVLDTSSRHILCYFHNFLS